MPPKAQKITKQNKIATLGQIKKHLHSKKKRGNINKVKTMCGIRKIFVNHISDIGLISPNIKNSGNSIAKNKKLN